MSETRAELLSTVHLAGRLGEDYGADHRFAVSSTREVFDALDARSPGFLSDLFRRAKAGECYDILVDGNATRSPHELFQPRENGCSYEFVEVPSGGVIEITILGVVLTVPQLIQIALLVALTLYTLLSKPPDGDDIQQAPGSGFDGQTNLGNPGNPVPLVYGETLTGSVLISASLSAEGKPLERKFADHQQAYTTAVEDTMTNDGEIDYPSASRLFEERTGRSYPFTIGDFIQQNQVMRLTDLISEGPIEGFGTDPDVTLAEKVFLDDTPMSQFSTSGIEFRLGTRDQETLALHAGDSAVTSVGITIHRVTGPISRTLQTKPLRILLTFSIQTLLFQGRTSPGSDTINLSIVVTDDNGNMIEKQQYLRALVLSKRSFTEEIEIPPHFQAPIKITVRKTSEDSGSKRQSVMAWDHYTEIGANKLRYPFSAIVGAEYYSHEFPGRVPSRKFLIKGRTVRVPDNYDGTTRAYSSTEWSGVLNPIEQWTDNPAWIILDYATSLRYGMGIPLENLDLWSLYECARRCDELVTSPGTNQEFRYSINTQAQKQRDSWTLLVELCATMEAKPWWDGSKIRFSQDRPAQSVWTFAPENVVDGVFEYTQSALSKRSNRVSVEWNNPDNFYRADVRSADDSESIRALGFHERRVRPIGIKYPGQASRYGHSILETEKLDSLIRFSTGTEGIAILPGFVFSVSDPAKDNGVATGRVKDMGLAGLQTVTLDRKVTLDGDATEYRLRMLLRALEVDITAPGDSSTLALPAPAQNSPVADDYRLIQVQEDINDTGDYSLVRDVIAYDPGPRIITLSDITATGSNRNYRVGMMRPEIDASVSGATVVDVPTDKILLAGSPLPDFDSIGAVWTLIDTRIITDMSTWKCVGMEELSEGRIEITGVLYDIEKYNRVDTAPAAPPGKIELPVGVIIPPPNGLLLTLKSRPSTLYGFEYYLDIMWREPRDDQGYVFDFIAGYKVTVRRDERATEDVIPLVEGTGLQYVVQGYGRYTVEVQTVQAATGKLSQRASATYIYDTGSLPEVAVRVNALHVIGSTDNTWTGPGFEIGWGLTYDGTMEFGDVEIPVMQVGCYGGLVVIGRSGVRTHNDILPNPTSATIVSSVVVLYTDRLDGNGYVERHRNSSVSSQKYSIDFEKNARMEGGPYNDMLIGVSVLDSFGRYSPETQIHVTNAPAAVPSLLSVEHLSTNLRWVFVLPPDSVGVILWQKEASTINDGSDLTPESAVHSGTNLSFSTPLKANTTYAYRWAAYDDFQQRDPNLLRGSGSTLKSGEFVFTSGSFDLGQEAIDGLALENGSVLPQHVRRWLVGGSGETFPITPVEGEYFYKYTINAEGKANPGLAYRYNGVDPYVESGWKLRGLGPNGTPDDIIVNDNILARTIFTEKLIVGDFFNHAIDHNFTALVENNLPLASLWDFQLTGGEWVRLVSDHPAPYSGVGNIAIDHSITLFPVPYMAVQGYPTNEQGKSFYGITCSQGDVYHFEFRLWTEHANPTPDYIGDTIIAAEIIFELADGSIVVEAGTAVIGDETWNTVPTVEATAPNNAVRVRCGLNVAPRSVGDIITATSYIDSLSFRKKTGTAYIEDASIIDAHIVDLKADKIAAGTLDVDVEIGVGLGDGKIIISGENTRIDVFDDSAQLRVRIGKIIVS